MTKRFKILDGALNYLRTNSDEANPDAPAGTPLKQYQDWKKGARNIEYTRQADSLPEALNDVKIIPFYYETNVSNLTIVPLSKRVQDESLMNAFLTAANVDAGETNPGRRLNGFIPAKCTVSIPDSTRDNANATSKLTGVSYKKKGAKTYTFPYGASTTDQREQSVRNKILAAVPNGSNYTLTFNSEEI